MKAATSAWPRKEVAVPDKAYRPKNWFIIEMGAMRAIIVRLVQNAAVMVTASRANVSR